MSLKGNLAAIALGAGLAYAGINSSIEGFRAKRILDQEVVRNANSLRMDNQRIKESYNESLISEQRVEYENNGILTSEQRVEYENRIRDYDSISNKLLYKAVLPALGAGLMFIFGISRILAIGDILEESRAKSGINEKKAEESPEIAKVVSPVKLNAPIRDPWSVKIPKYRGKRENEK